MFDDQLSQSPTAKTGAIPPNLPIGEPDDIFQQVDEPVLPVADISSFVPQDIPASPIAAPSALDAGILKPARPAFPDIDGDDDIVTMPQAMQDEEPMLADVPAAIPPMSSSEKSFAPDMPSASRGNGAGIFGQPPEIETPPPLPQGEQYMIKEPSLSRGIMAVIIFSVVLLILAGGAWWVYTAVFANTQEQVVQTPFDEIPSSQTGTNTVSNPIPPSVPNVDDRLLFGALQDTDSDGLDDDQERSLGLNPNDWDSDDDELSDGDEVIIWKTNPLNPDTDGDSYTDGTEVKSGYSPSGIGRIFEVPQATASSTLSPSTTSTAVVFPLTVLADLSVGSCTQDDIDNIFTESMQVLAAQGKPVSLTIRADDPLFPLFISEIQKRVARCGQQTTVTQ